MKRLLACIAIASLAAGSSPAATDTHAAAQGNGRLVYADGSSTVTCVAPLAVSLAVRANLAVVTESWGPGSPGTETCAVPTIGFQYFATNAYPGVRQCIPGASNVTMAVFDYRLSQVDSTYTLRSTGTTCSGRRLADTISVTVRPASLAYSHVYSENEVELVRATGTLPRVA